MVDDRRSILAALVAWQLGAAPPAARAQLRVIAWGFALRFAGVTIVSWRYLFIIPVVLSAVITLCLAAAAGRSRG